MNELKINGIYKHFKGDYYLVEGIAKYSETKEEMVLYRRLYEDGGLWVRADLMAVTGNFPHSIASGCPQEGIVPIRTTPPFP